MKEFSETKNISTCLNDRNITVNECKFHLPDHCAGENQHRRDIVGSMEHRCASVIHVFRTIAHRNLTELTNKQIYKLIPGEWRNYLRKTDVPKNGRLFRKFVEHEICMREVERNLLECKTEHFNNEWCTSKQVQFAKVLRANMETMESLLQAMPDLHIVHYLRDPRAISTSVANVYPISWNSSHRTDVVPESIVLCDKMAKDIVVRKKLEKKYPGAFITASYEELVKEPTNFANKIYQFLGLEVPKQWFDHTLNAMFHSGANETNFGHVRQNASVTVKKWYKTISYYNMVSTTAVCKILLEELGYTAFPSLKEML